MPRDSDHESRSSTPEFNRHVESERVFRAIFDRAALGIVYTTPGGRYLRANRAFCRITGYDADELLEMNFRQITHPDDLDNNLEHLDLMTQGEIDAYTVEKRYVRKDGGMVWVRLTASPIRDESGKILYAVGMVEDITERRRAEADLRAARDLLWDIVEFLPDATFVIDRDRRVIAWNRAIEEMSGVPKETMLGAGDHAYAVPFYGERRPVAIDLIGGDDPAAEARYDFFERRGGKVYAQTFVQGLYGGRGAHIWVTASPLLDAAGQVVGAIESVRDITRRVEAEERLRESERRLSTLIGNLPGIAYRCGNTPDWPMEFIGGALVELTGYETPELLDDGGIGYGDIVHPDDRATVWEAVQAGVAADRPFQIEYRIVTKDGSTKWVWEQGRAIRDEAGDTIALEGFIADITDRTSLEEQLRQSVKMEAIGRLAGGVAHDFNNLLTAIIGYGDMLAEELGPDDPRREDIEEIRRASERAAALTGRLLAFSRRQIIHPEVIDVNEIVADLDRMLRRMIGEHIELETELAPGLASVRADRGQIEQVVMNLVVNARDAIGENGRIVLKTSDVALDEAAAGRIDGAAPGPHVLLAVLDDGVGMDEETVERIFEPFFTTKPESGTGLGLSTVYGIVRQGGGGIEVESSPGRGAEFRVYLPAVDEAVERRPAAREGAAAGGTERVLVVEDEEAVRALVDRVLAGHGYRVTAAASPEEALAAAGEASFDLVLSDLVLPGMGGRRLVEALRERGCEGRVLFMSGYTDDVVVSREVRDAGIPFIQKPFSVDVLLRAVRAAIDGG